MFFLISFINKPYFLKKDYKRITNMKLKQKWNSDQNGFLSDDICSEKLYYFNFVFEIRIVRNLIVSQIYPSDFFVASCQLLDVSQP